MRLDERVQLRSSATSAYSREIIRLLEADGWYLVATKGSHRQYKHEVKAGRVTVAGKPSEEVAPGTLNSILKQSGLKE
ncbi:type II toxin-antitoxin system HicA family toxin [Mesorhizobium sp. M7A.F.Ca.MR.148.00.0.0]|uniref:type II toxin-antitoxin system HicA family toxin n=1 Tax=Mesorhizobium sp. M7A.F.Ca.MR.148.00.0.0 TaxID=2496775 RepID=UPI001FE17FBB|nr:type II toxin-antitoxin system HicA family toxin [Mesorhizobium sp. M7A.F.Ca.MR.148.00.0.0]